MFALCIESSHQRGMGHFFRALNFYDYLLAQGEQAIFLLNDDQRSINLLGKRHTPFRVVDLRDFQNDWEGKIIRSLGITVWFNDRLDTDKRHAEKVKKAGALLVTVDDRGGGAEISDLHFAPLVFDGLECLKGAKVFHGADYLILNPEIMRYRRLRTVSERTIISLGGSDTHGVTLKVLKIFQRLGKRATIHVGPGFCHQAELMSFITPDYPVLNAVPSLIETFSHFDLAITGGGVTPFEANAAGLPCIIVANEAFEIPVAYYLSELGSSLFAGHHNNIDEAIFSKQPNIATMSKIGLDQLSLDGAANIYREIITK